MSDNIETSLTVPGQNAIIRNNFAKVSVIQKVENGSADYVPHVSAGQVKLLSITAGRNKRHGARNAVLIKFLFDGCLRISEAINVCPADIQKTPDGWTARIMGKGHKPGVVAISSSIAAEIQAYCYQTKIEESCRIFPISRSQTWRIVAAAFDGAGIHRPNIKEDRVGAQHVLRHSGAIERLKITRNPKATQDQLRHKDARMTLRYFKTVSQDESLQTNQQVDLWQG